MTNLAVKIAVIESEAGFGSRLDDWMVCLSIEDAHQFKKEFNAENNKSYVPSWYMRAEGEALPIELNDKQYQKLLSGKRAWLSTLKSNELHRS